MDPRAKLLAGPAWETTRARVCRTLGLPAALPQLATELDEAHRRTAGRFAANTAVELDAGKFKLSTLDRLDEPESLEALAPFTAKARAQALERMGPERRLAHLVAFAATLEATALDAFDLVVGELLGKAALKAQRERLRTLGDRLAVEAFGVRRRLAGPPGRTRCGCRCQHGRRATRVATG